MEANIGNEKVSVKLKDNVSVCLSTEEPMSRSDLMSLGQGLPVPTVLCKKIKDNYAALFYKLKLCKIAPKCAVIFCIISNNIALKCSTILPNNAKLCTIHKTARTGLHTVAPALSPNCHHL